MQPQAENNMKNYEPGLMLGFPITLDRIDKTAATTGNSIIFDGTNVIWGNAVVGGPFSSITGTPTEIAYFDLAGNGYSDALATRHPVTNETEIAQEQAGNYTARYKLGSIFTGFLEGVGLERQDVAGTDVGSILVADGTPFGVTGNMVVGYVGDPAGYTSNTFIHKDALGGNVSTSTTDTQYQLSDGQVDIQTGNDQLGGDDLLEFKLDLNGGNGNQIAEFIYKSATAYREMNLKEDGFTFKYDSSNTPGTFYTFPTTDGTAGQTIVTDGNGLLSWQNAGGSLQWYAENATAPATAPIATGTGSIALGDGAEALSSNMFVYGENAGQGVSNGQQSNFLGSSAGNSATNANNSNFLGSGAGENATNANNSNFFGSKSGESATNASESNFIGEQAGNGATDASNSNFIGRSAGVNATNANNSNFLGNRAGQNATNAVFSNFIGNEAGYDATNAEFSNFLGGNAGNGATDASNSFFVGQNAGAYNLGGSGLGTQNANNSIFIGNNAGYFAADNTLDNSTGGTSILIGDDTSTGGFSNSIAIGKGATNTATNEFMVGSSTSPIDTMKIIGTGGIQVPVGTTAERVAIQGMIRYNTTISKFEGYDGTTWHQLH